MSAEAQQPTIVWDRPQHIPAPDLQATSFQITGDYLAEIDLFCPVCPDGLGIVRHEGLRGQPTIAMLLAWIEDHIEQYHRSVSVPLKPDAVAFS